MKLRKDNHYVNPSRILLYLFNINTMKKISFLLLAIALVFSFCKKYEDGPAVSLLSAKSRVSGDWKAYKYMINGRDSSSKYLQGGFGVNIAKDGLYNTTGADADQGTWHFDDNKESIVFRSSDPASTEEEKYRIKRLKNKDLWLFRDYGNGYTVELRFKQ